MPYIYQCKKWPHFFWNDEALASLLAKVHYHQGKLCGQMSTIGFSLREETLVETLTQDVAKSSEIEGELLDLSQVRSSVARHLGLEVAGLPLVDRHIDGIVEMVLDATQKYDAPLTEDRMLGWHSALFPTGRSHLKKIRVGEWRTQVMQIVSGPMSKEQIHYEAPPPEIVDEYISQFLNWYNENETLDPVLKSGIAHLWFLTIHPFDDGNGRIARALSDMLLARSERSLFRFYSLSAQIQLDRKEYYAILEKTQKGSLDITSWLKWFLGCLERSIENADVILKRVFQKAHFWESLSGFSLNERQHKMINLLLDGSFFGNLSSSKWAKINKCSQDTAERDISLLMKQGILMKSVEGGRSTHYYLSSLSS